MEIDTKGHVTFMNTQGMITLGFDNNDLTKGVSLPELFMNEDLDRLMRELSDLTKPGQITFDEYYLLNKQKRKGLGALSCRTHNHKEQGHRIQMCSYRREQAQGL